MSGGTVKRGDASARTVPGYPPGCSL